MEKKYNEDTLETNEVRVGGIITRLITDTNLWLVLEHTDYYTDREGVQKSKSTRVSVSSYMPKLLEFGKRLKIGDAIFVRGNLQSRKKKNSDEYEIGLNAFYISFINTPQEEQTQSYTMPKNIVEKKLPATEQEIRDKAKQALIDISEEDLPF